MKRDLLIAGILIVAAALGIGVVVNLPAFQKEDKPKTIKPKPEPIAEVPKKLPLHPAPMPEKPPIEKKIEPEPKKIIAKVEPEPKKVEEKKVIAKVEPEPKKIEEKKVIAKVEPEPKKIEEKKVIAKVEPEPKKIDVKIEPKKAENKQPAVKIIAVGDDLIKLNDPDGEYTVKSMSRGMKIKLIGTIKTLHIAGVNERSVLDVTGLVADEIILTGNINSGSSVLLGQAKTLKIRDINDNSLLDASALDARAIHLDGAVNSNSTVKLHAPKGTVEFVGEINDRSKIEIAAPEGKVVFKTRGDSVINGDAKLTILARDLEFAGAINGTQTQLDVTLTKNGTLKFRRISGGVRFHYRKTDASDPDPRIDMGQVDARADFRPMPATKK